MAILPSRLGRFHVADDAAQIQHLGAHAMIVGHGEDMDGGAVAHDAKDVVLYRSRLGRACQQTRQEQAAKLRACLHFSPAFHLFSLWI